MLRVQPLANEVNATGAANVGRDVRTLPPGTITVTSTSHNASNTLGSQPLVARCDDEPAKRRAARDADQPPFISGQTLCVTQSDGNRRDNVPNSGGEVGPGQAAVTKVSRLDQRLDVPGLPLPVK